MDNRVELLSPAGNLKCFYSAVNAGADAVYAGLLQFGARSFAGNLTSDEYIEAIDHGHLLGVRVYLTLNILIKDREFSSVDELITPLYAAGLDGVIVQDIGLISHLKDKYPLLDVHVSTQAFVTGAYGVEFLKSLGVKRVVLPRELSLREIRNISERTGMELECFIHGAMCYSYSGMCLMSSFLGGRSGNRGRCAGPCRQPYGGADREDYILSMKDLCGIEMIPPLIAAGASSLKIEGRMKPPEYVYAVTRMYRRYIDLFYEEGEGAFHVREDDLKTLSSIYSRGGLNCGYFEKRNGPEMITRKRGSYNSALPEAGKEERKTLGAECSVILNKGKEAVLILRSKGREVRVTGDRVEEAKNRPLRQEEIRKQLGKTGNSAFSLSNMEIRSDGDIFMPVSSLNELRRRGLNELKEEILSGYRRSV